MEEDFLSLSEESKKYYIYQYIINESDISKVNKFLIFLLQNGVKYLFNGLLATYLKYKVNYTNNERLKYYYTFDNYQLLIDKFKKLTEELNLSNSMEISDLYTYLLWNGYFSITKKNIFQVECGVVLDGLYSYNLVTGVGVCLNHSDLLKDLLNGCGYDACNLIASINKFTRTYTPNITRNMKLGFFDDKSLIGKLTGNHAFTLIKENNEFYIYDSTNFAIYRVINQKKCSIINGNDDFRTFPIESYLYNFTDKSKKTLNEFISKKEFMQTYTLADFQRYFEKILEIISENVSLIEDYYQDIFDNLFSINNVIEGVKRTRILK